MAVQKRNGLRFLGGRHLAGALALLVCAAAMAAAQPRELNASTRARRLDVQRSLAAREAVKISVTRAGWYRLTQPQLAAAGLPANSNPHNLRLFADGVEQPIRVIGRAEGRFEAGDAIEFYGTGVDTPFTDAHVYWLTTDSPGIRVPVDDGRIDILAVDQHSKFVVIELSDTTTLATCRRDTDESARLFRHWQSRCR